MKDEIKKKKINIAIRTTDVTTKSTASITTRPHRTFWIAAQNKEYETLQIPSRILTRFNWRYYIE